MIKMGEGYIFWFETQQLETVINDLTAKLTRLGVRHEIINGVKRPAIINVGDQQGGNNGIGLHEVKAGQKTI